MVGGVEGNGCGGSATNHVLHAIRAEPPSSHKHIVDIANDGGPQVSVVLRVQGFGEIIPSEFVKRILINAQDRFKGRPRHGASDGYAGNLYQVPVSESKPSEPKKRPHAR